MVKDGGGTVRHALQPASRLSAPMAARLARVALNGVTREYPRRIDHVLHGPDPRPPREQHPAFYGCYDWHSAVHGHWTLARLLRLFPGLPEAGKIRAVLGTHLAGRRLAVEAATFREPGRESFERPYGWAWLLKLAAELHAWTDPEAQAWADGLRPLAHLLAERFGALLPRQTYPVRCGTHGNSAFSLALVLDYCRSMADQELEALVARRARHWFLKDRTGATWLEPSGEDFLSPCLEEAALMAGILGPGAFGRWLCGFLPSLERSPLVVPARVSDRTDPHIVHLDGLNLSRARALRTIAAALHPGDHRRTALERAAVRHGRAALPHVASGHYGGEHWLATFALRLLEPGD